MTTPNTFGSRLAAFLTGFPAAPPLPGGVAAHHPYQTPPAAELLLRFGQRYYADNQPRVALLGINPGRFGAGTTGVAFTDPAALQHHCGIANTLPHRAELSSQFVYQLVVALGGASEFYRHFYLGSLYPLVLLREGKNYNYYDAPALTQALWPQMQYALRQQADLGLRRDVAISLGRRNGEYFQKLNHELGLFGRVLVFDHPRYLMQYKRRAVPEFVARYAAELAGLL
ncbi:uracil-DNA glycosylase family protein [Hymenobacter latericus]|uniref:uracil-DNA glycosylase family protein n=1 Tax=Hymenobacter sp. YIM 151858-1 TaxID=2987688 RepID=UPI0022263F8A|nr:uracil-DNA glycosylase family protein [Hymenobacter sp. YIM 151858-1]UYZ59971.1 DUF4918 family protein [Hymenobacter sp. YIM 151858-1]